MYLSHLHLLHFLDYFPNKENKIDLKSINR